MNPAILFPSDPDVRSRQINTLKEARQSPLTAPIWKAVEAAAHRERDEPPYLVDSLFPGRDTYSAEILGMDWTLCNGICMRITRHALFYILEEDEAWLRAALEQTEVLFDEAEYPAWSHFARMKQKVPEYEKVHLRTGMLAKGVGILFNWLRPHLTPEQQRRIVDGLEKQAIAPYLEAIKANPWWIQVNHNWLSCVVGGLGICGMALEGAHPEAQNLVDFADPLMDRHLKDFGSEGEFNEGLGYAGAIGLSVDYYSAKMGISPEVNYLREWPFPDLARFFMHMTVPPGHLFTFGDGVMGKPLKADWVAAVATACQDPVLQDFYLRFRSIMADPCQLLVTDPKLETQSPQGRLPLGKAFTEHGACIASRTSWDWETTDSVVGSKARREDNHEHNDPGQVVLYGQGEPLLVDWGTPSSSYPAQFFTENRFHYFDSQAFGHNVLVFGGREMKSCYELHPNFQKGALHGKKASFAQGSVLYSEFDDNWGGQWTIDTAPCWEGVLRNQRQVLHLHPGLLVVLDEAKLEREETISLRWNCIREPELGKEGEFQLNLDRVGLAGRILPLTGAPSPLRVDKQRYEEPWNKDQFGGLLPDRDCPYVELLLEGSACRLLSLFGVAPGPGSAAWTGEPDESRIDLGGKHFSVVATDSSIAVTAEHSGRTWSLPFSSI